MNQKELTKTVKNLWPPRFSKKNIALRVKALKYFNMNQETEGLFSL